MKYRREIDGLRALAVLPVLFFHAGFKAFSGGYVGVDIFFVISGYLITTIIVSDLEKDSFSLLRFYERRARRILPALFFVLFCCLPFGWLWLLPSHLIDFSESLIGVATFSSNILFWLESGYFDTVSELKPLLHTWSLAVEEQYYLLFPVFMLLMFRFSKRRLVVYTIVSVSVLSFLVAHWGYSIDPSAVFYLLPTRIWELGLGAVASFYLSTSARNRHIVIEKKWPRELMSIIGLGLVVLSVVTFDAKTPFPGFYALIPTVGTVLMILFASSETSVGKLLSMKVLVGVGLISYSAYLWHQPLFVFYRHRNLSEESDLVLMLLIALTIVLAYISWRFVEVPFRGGNRISRMGVFVFALVGTLVFAAIGVLGKYNSGWPSRLPEQALTLTAEAKVWEKKPDNRFMNSENGYVYLIGDSYAAQLVNSLNEKLFAKEYGFYSNFFWGCPPVQGVYRPDMKDGRLCLDFSRDVYNFAYVNADIKYVVLFANWSMYAQGNMLEIIDPDVTSRSNGSYSDRISAIYTNSIKRLLDSGKYVVLVYPVPGAYVDVPDYLLKKSFFENVSIENIPPTEAATDYSVYKNDQRNRTVFHAFDRIKGRGNLIRIYPEEIFCTSIGQKCITHNNGEIYYYDQGHLSRTGADLLVEKIVDEIAKYSMRISQ